MEINFKPFYGLWFETKTWDEKEMDRRASHPHAVIFSMTLTLNRDLG
jgi:hypothetical protein